MSQQGALPGSLGRGPTQAAHLHGPHSHELGPSSLTGKPGAARAGPGCHPRGPQSGEPVGFDVASGWGPSHIHTRTRGFGSAGPKVDAPFRAPGPPGEMGCWKEGVHPLPAQCYCSVTPLDSPRWARTQQAGPRLSHQPLPSACCILFALSLGPRGHTRIRRTKTWI